MTIKSEEVNKYYSSEIIRGRLNHILKDETLESFLRDKYKRDVKECLDILDINYPVTAVGILGRVLENSIKEYCNILIKRKTMFEKNTSNLPIRSIRNKILETTQDNRLKLLVQNEVKINQATYKLKRKLLKDDDYNALVAIKNARNDAFHGCTDDKYAEIAAKSYSLIERGLIILVLLENEIVSRLM